MNLESPITEVKGIGAKTEKLMNKIGVYTVGDILLHYPRDYVRFKEPLSAGEITQEGIYAVIGKITSALHGNRTGKSKRYSRQRGIDLVSDALCQKPVKITGNVYLLWKSQTKGQTVLHGTAADLYDRTVPAENADLAAGICKDRRTQQSDDHKNNPSGIRGNFVKL